MNFENIFADTDYVVFVGTSTRIPMVQGILPGVSQHESIESFEQDKAAIYGIPVRAAQFAEDMLKQFRHLSLNDFTSFSLRPIINEQVQKQLVKKNSKISLARCWAVVLEVD
uniref:Uncharacterized protein n=1 Tax=Glossina austeni TaxID=7395 RepID=A0A1A9VLM2_GLOAU